MNIIIRIVYDMNNPPHNKKAKNRTLHIYTIILKKIPKTSKKDFKNCK